MREDFAELKQRPVSGLGFAQLGVFAFFEMVVFVTILVGGLIYAWKEGALEWR